MGGTATIALHGRDAELDAIGELLDGARRGRGGVLLLAGVPGIGKTRLLQEALRIAGRLGIRTGYSGADPAEMVVELAPLLRALFDGAEPILERTALPSLRGGAEQRYWLLQDLQALLEQAGADGPLAICIDDAQWADDGTLAALRELPAQLASLPIVWIVAARTAGVSAAWLDVVGRLLDGGAQRIVLEPLAADAVAELARDTIAARPDQSVLKLAASAAGNPFFLVELLRGLSEERLIRVEDGEARLLETRLPSRVDAGMRQRLARLSESARQTAITAASLGRRFSVSELVAMLDVTPATLLTPIEQLVDADVFAERGDGLSFRHDLIREAIRSGTPAAVRRALDRQAVDVLLGAGAVPDEVAVQLADSAEPGDEAAVALLVEVAETLGQRAPLTAAELSRRALELVPTGDPLTGRLVASTTVMLHAGGEPAAAQEFAQQHLRDVLSAHEEAAVCLSLASMFALSPDLRAASGRRALALAGLSEHERAEQLARLVYNLIQAGRAGEAVELVDSARTAVELAGDPGSRSILRQSQALLAYVLDADLQRALALHEQTMRDGFGRGEETRGWVARQWRAELLAGLDRHEEALALLAAGVAEAQRERQGFALEFLDIWRGHVLFQTGALADAAAVLEGRFDPAAAAPTGALYAAGVVAVGRIAIHTGDERRKRELAAVARAMVQSGTPANAAHGGWLLALLDMAAGVVPDASGLLLPRYPMDVADEPQLVRIALAAGDRELAKRASSTAAQRAQTNPGVATIQAVALHARGLLEADSDALARACELYVSSPRRLAFASALEDLGAARLRDGADPQAGVEDLGRALELYTELGASWDAGRVRGRLRLSGVRRRLVASARPRTGFDALTESELAVVRLVTQGMTNREAAEQLFLSPHTVNSHLRHAFTKLEVNSRVELARAISTQEAVS